MVAPAHLWGWPAGFLLATTGSGIFLSSQQPALTNTDEVLGRQLINYPLGVNNDLGYEAENGYFKVYNLSLIHISEPTRLS